ncbi:MAG: NADH-quinone oxidoreductase subunit M [Deltaproteobacteria bacterium]|nr:MAG: NADH-quinone oxidoreductase subunit M [Deltaproteobacteria bacterium]
MNHLLSIVLVLPILGALTTALLPRGEERLAKGLGLFFSGLTFLVSLPLATEFEHGVAGMQFEEKLPWIERFGISYHVGVDGLSVWLVLLATFLTPICIWGAWRSVEHRSREFVASMLVLETGMTGALVALDLILFFTFWEVMLVPMALIIGIWGSEQRIKAAIKFFLYTMVGSALMLAAILYLAVAHYELSGGTFSFDLADLDRVVLPPKVQALCFWAFVASFAIKVPLFPVHTWLPDAHTQAPTPGSVILAGVLLKLGTYGFIRFAMPLFPGAAGEAAQALAILAIVGIVYGALTAYAQEDVKRLVAYSSVSHMGFVVLGIVGMTPQGLTGATYQSLAHGLTTGALFMCIGVLYERRHTRKLDAFGGLAKVMPVFTAVFMIAMLGSAGLPGLVGFVGEFLIMVGTFSGGAHVLNNPPLLVLVAATGVILGAVYLLHMFQKVMFGPIVHAENEHLPDLGLRERLVFLPVIALIVVMGVYPKPFLETIDPSAQALVSHFTAKRCASVALAESGAKKAAFAEDLMEACADPMATIRAAYGDERAPEVSGFGPVARHEGGHAP